MTKFIIISLTNKCNKSCVYCPVKRWINNPAYPDKLNYKKLTEFLSRMQPDYVEITGGEPTLVPWLDELCDYMEGNGIKYLVKSNGTNKCRNQVSAWHDEFPKYYNYILIIAYPGFKDKIKYCEEHDIKYKVIGHAGLQGASYDPIWQEVRQYSKRELDIVPSPIQTIFVCPSGRVKQCHEREFDGCNEVAPLMITDDLTWGMTCHDCKSAYDFFLFTSS